MFCASALKAQCPGLTGPLFNVWEHQPVLLYEKTFVKVTWYFLL